MDKVAIIAFDGMDLDLIEEYDLDNIKQEEFGSLDNDTGIRFRFTSELFASFITGETWEEHGVIGLSRPERTKIKRRLWQGVIPSFLRENYRGFTRLNHVIKRTLIEIGFFEDMKYTKEDLNAKNMFDEMETAKPLFVPGYNPDPRWQLGLPHKVSEVTDREEVRDYSRKLTESRLEDFYDLSFSFWDMIMLHLHDPDAIQDLELGNYREEYERLNRIAGEIKKSLPDEWTVIFMSDHGRMEERAHNKKAFYSCSEELFGNQTPHITDFYQKIV